MMMMMMMMMYVVFCMVGEKVWGACHLVQLNDESYLVYKRHGYYFLFWNETN